MQQAMMPRNITMLAEKLIIDKSLIGDYFSTIKAKYNMIDPSDIKEYAQDMFLCK